MSGFRDYSRYHKRHYEDIALILNKSGSCSGSDIRRSCVFRCMSESSPDYCALKLIDNLVSLFEQDNPNFDKEKFIKAVYSDKEN